MVQVQLFAHAHCSHQPYSLSTAGLQEEESAVRNNSIAATMRSDRKDVLLAKVFIGKICNGKQVFNNAANDVIVL